MALTLENEFVVEAGIETTWETLLDLGRVARCLPGASIGPAEEDGSHRGSMKVKLGPVSMAYQGVARLTEVDPERHVATFDVQGKETRGQGTATATIKNSLVEDGSSTRVRVETELSVTGRPAQFGRGIMQDVAGKMLSDFAACLQREISGPTPSDETISARVSAPPDDGVPPQTAQPAENEALDLSGAVSRVLARRVWKAAGLAALVGAVAAVLRRRKRPER
jgi:uncharacterized protein